MGTPRVLTPMLEHFKPVSEWRQEDDHDTLLVYLPGFENIEVTTEDLNIVRVHGGRFTDHGNWSEVNEDYRVPESCEMRRIRSSLDGGILTITMPRKMVNTQPAKETWLDAGEGMHTLLEEMSKNSKDGTGRKDDGRAGGLQGENDKKVVARRGMMNEDRKLLVNVGVGVLVIVALGVHVSYTIGLIGKGK